MIKAKVVVRYKDIKLDKLLEAGEVIEITEARFEEINSKGFGILVERVEEEIEEDNKEEKTEEIEEVTENEEEIKDIEVEEKPKKKKTTNKK